MSYAVWTCQTCGDERVYGSARPLNGTTALLICLNPKCAAPTRLARVRPDQQEPVRVTLHRFLELTNEWVGPRSTLAVRGE